MQKQEIQGERKRREELLDRLCDIIHEHTTAERDGQRVRGEPSYAYGIDDWEACKEEMEDEMLRARLRSAAAREVK